MVECDSTIEGVLDSCSESAINGGYKGFDVTSYNLGLVEDLKGGDGSESVRVEVLVSTKMESVELEIDMWWGNGEWCGEVV